MSINSTGGVNNSGGTTPTSNTNNTSNTSNSKSTSKTNNGGYTPEPYVTYLYEDTVGSAPPGGVLAGLDTSNQIPLMVLGGDLSHSLQELKNSIYNASLADLQAISNLIDSVFQNLLSVGDLNKLLSLTNQWENIAKAANKNINSMNSSTTSFEKNISQNKTNDQKSVTTLNSAIQNYNKAKAKYDSNPSKANKKALNNAINTYNSDASAYNSYVTGRNNTISQYNNNVSSYNSILTSTDPNILASATNIASINEQRAQYPELQPIDVSTSVDANGNPVTLKNAPTFTVLQSGGNPPTQLDSSNLPNSISQITSPDLSNFSQLQPSDITIIPTSAQIGAIIDLVSQGLLTEGAVINEAINLITQQLASDIIYGGYSSKLTLKDILKEKKNSAINLGHGPGSSLLASFGNLNNTANLDRILSDALLRGVLHHFQLKNAKRLLKNLQTAQLQLLFGTGILSAFPAAKPFVNDLNKLTPGNPAFSVTHRLTMIQNLIRIVSSGQINRLVKNLLNQELEGGGELSPTAVNQLTNAITSVFQASVLGVGLMDLSLTLGLPGLTGQVLANLGSISPQDAQLAASPGGSQLRAILENPLSMIALENAVPGINEAIQNIGSKGAQLNHEEFKAALSDQLQKIMNLTPAEANQLAGFAFSFIRAELAGVPLDIQVGSNFNPAAITGALGLNPQIAGTLQSGNFGTYREVRHTIATGLQESGTPATTAFYQGNQAVNIASGGTAAPSTGISQPRLNSLQQSLGNPGLFNQASGQGPFASEAEYLFVLRNEFAKAGKAPQFDHAVAGLSTGGGSITAPGLGQIIPPGTISTELQQEVVGILQGHIGKEEAKKWASDLVKGLLGDITPHQIENQEVKNPNSLMNQMDSQHKEILKTSDRKEATKIHDALIEHFRSLIKPSAQEAYLTHRTISEGPDAFTQNLNEASARQAIKVSDTLFRG